MMARKRSTARPGDAVTIDDAASARLRAAGQRYTSQRRALVSLLAGAGSPLPVPAILAAGGGLTQSSAYRNLAVLEQAGVVRRVVTDEDFARYEPTEELMGHHHHLVCSECGRVEDVALPTDVEAQLDRSLDRLARGAGFASVSHRLDLIGICRDCG
ncbi:MAG: Fur family transcriptional regulator [Actinomycetota bacterium]